jgi:hypothetical protein
MQEWLPALAAKDRAPGFARAPGALAFVACRALGALARRGGASCRWRA